MLAPFLKHSPSPGPLPEGPELHVVEAEQAPTGPKFITHLRLTPEREKWLVDRAINRIAEVMREMGLNDDGTTDPDSWMGRRQRYQDTYDNDLAWRKQILGGVFVKSNLTLGTTKRYVREMSAKVNDDLLGTSPFFGAVKRKEGAGPLAKAVEEYVQEKIELSNLPKTLREGIRTALIRNEAIVKTRHEIRATPFVGPATVMVKENGEPIITPHGYMVYENDDFLPDPNVEGLFRLKKDPLFAMKPGEYGYQEFPELAQTAYDCEGLEGAILDHRSFLCPLRIPSIHKADINVQLYDETIERLSETYAGFEVFDRYSRAGSETSGEYQPKTAKGEIDEREQSSVIRRIRMAEVYIRCDADEDGREEEIMLVLDRDAKAPVFYEYLKVQMDKRPFEVIPGVETVPNRWYGTGIIEMLEDPNNYIDAQFNRINTKDSRESSATFRDPAAVKEWKAGMPVELGTNKIYDVEQGYDQQTRPPIWRVNLNEVPSELGWNLMQKAEQAGNLQFGVISAKDASTSNMNQSRTATGILSLERTNNNLTKATEIDQIEGVEAVLNQGVTIVLDNMKDSELFFSKDGAILHTLSKEEVRGIEREVKLLLTRSRSTELLATNQQALQIAKDYYALKAQDPMAARGLRPLYVEQLKSLEVSDADDLLPQVTDAEIEAWQQARNTPPPTPPREFLNYKDSPPSIKRQMEAEAGFEPATEEEQSNEAAAIAAKAQPKAGPTAPTQK